MQKNAIDSYEGRKCYRCGQYFANEAEHGYPVLCDECWNETSEKTKASSLFLLSKSIYKVE